MREINLNDFIEGVEQGYITDVVFIGNNINRVYGKDPRGQADNPQKYELVWATVP